MDVSVIICTWNRASSLEKTLRSLCSLQIPPGAEWELLVVNNNCTDHTSEVVASFAEALPARLLFQPEQGLSAARNLGIREARGRWVAFTDDDILVDAEWLGAYLAAAERWPKTVCFGGTIEPFYEEPPPAWVIANEQLLQGLLGLRRFESAEGPFPAGEDPYGANMMFRRETLEKRAFDTRLGLRATEQLQSEETQLFEDMRGQGHPPIWVPKARVHHLVRSETLTDEYVWRRFHGYGRSMVRRDDPTIRSKGRARLVFDCCRCWWLKRQAAMLRACGCTAWPHSLVKAARLQGILDERLLREASHSRRTGGAAS